MYRGVRLPGTKMAETSGTLGVTVEQKVKLSFSTTPTYTVRWCKRSASQSRLSRSYQLAYTVKLGCSSVRNVLVLPWKWRGCLRPVMGLRTTLRKTVLTDPLWVIYCRVLNMFVLFSTLCKTFIHKESFKVQDTGNLLPPAGSNGHLIITDHWWQQLTLSPKAQKDSSSER